jgi:DNA-binding transcriptional LysR family regulator
MEQHVADRHPHTGVTRLRWLAVQQRLYNGCGPLLGTSRTGDRHMPEDQALPDIKARRLVRMLDDWCPPFPGYHLYYPSRRHASSAFAVMIDALRYRGR